MKNITIHIQIFPGTMNSLVPAAPVARKSFVHGKLGRDKDAHKEKKFWIGKIIKTKITSHHLKTSPKLMQQNRKVEGG